jgi:hypothetical protein
VLRARAYGLCAFLWWLVWLGVAASQGLQRRPAAAARGGPCNVLCARAAPAPAPPRALRGIAVGTRRRGARGRAADPMSYVCVLPILF